MYGTPQLQAQQQQLYGAPQMQVQQMQLPMQTYGAQPTSYASSAAPVPRRIKFVDAKAPPATTASDSASSSSVSPESEVSNDIVAVIVTICSGGSYDALFSRVEQKSAEGRVSVWQTDYASFGSLLELWKSKDKDAPDVKANGEGSRNERWQAVMEECGDLPANAVLFNFECCGHCSERALEAPALEVIGELVARGHALMFSDFSLKSLIASWRGAADGNCLSKLGPCPFVQLRTMSSRMELSFDPEQLAQCASTQLAKVGELSAGGHVSMHAMGGTIVYGVDSAAAKRAADAGNYTLELLTVVTQEDGSKTPLQSEHNVSIKRHSGPAGHTMVTFPSGATMLTSCGHWVELVKIDTSIENVLRVAEKMGGAESAKAFATQYYSAPVEAQAQMLQATAFTYVQSAVPQQCAIKKA
jgi:hypothetical protein